MTRRAPANEAPREKDGAVDHRLRKTYPAGNHHVDPDEDGPKRSQKQVGQDLRDPQERADEDE